VEETEREDFLTAQIK